MSLPPLPPSTIYDIRQGLNGHPNNAMQAYGQQCRDAALEEAAQRAESAYLSDSNGYQIAEQIRSLK